MLARISTLLMVFAGVAAAAPLHPLPPQPSPVPWPTMEWPTAPLPAGVDKKKLDELLAVTAAPQKDLGETRAVVIVQRGQLVAERYMPGYTRNTPLLSWSMAKSVTHALVGIAVRMGKLDVDKPMGYPRWASEDERAKIPWRNWLNMIDGQDYHEIGVINQAKNDAARMLYGEGRLDVALFASTLPLVHPPGTFWNYNSAGVNLMASALGRVFVPSGGPEERRHEMLRLMKSELFLPIGMTSAQPEFDRSGNFVGSALVYANARDWARFGLLYLRGGVWEGRRILPEGWVDFARTKTPADNCDVYGAGFWVTPASGTGKPYSSLSQKGPRDLFVAQGHEGQVIVIVPSKDLIVVRLGRFDDRVGFPALGEWVDAVVNLFPDQ
jgi:CubicO group peptidase (beta-lactamase class C family)